MKKLVCLLAVVPLLLAGCGRQKIVLEGNGGVAYVERNEEPDLSNKVRPENDSEEPGNDSKPSAPPKVKGENDTWEVPEENAPVQEPSDIPETTYDMSGDGEVQEASENTPETTTAAPTEAPTENKYRYQLDGVVLELSGNTLIINESDLQKVSLACDEGQIKDLRPGDRVEVKYDGVLTNKSPKSGTAYTVSVVKKADKRYEIRRFAYKDLSFSMLIPENWESRVIEYPQEGDFTDWGIRIQPKGASGSFDVSWHSAFAIREPFDKLRKKVNGIDAKEYSLQGKWKFLEFTNNNFIIANNFYGTDEYDTYIDEVSEMIATLEF